MLVAGIDVGAATAKTVILADGEILGYAVYPVGHDIKSSVDKTSKEALRRAGLSTSIENLDYVVSTGYARESIKFADKTVTEIICHAKGVHFMIPSVRFIIDMGGQDSKAIEIGPQVRCGHRKIPGGYGSYSRSGIDGQNGSTCSPKRRTLSDKQHLHRIRRNRSDSTPGTGEGQKRFDSRCTQGSGVESGRHGSKPDLRI
jgi:hypothetical protein